FQNACRTEPERLFAEAARAERAGDYAEAVEKLGEIVIADSQGPHVPRALFELAQLHLLRTRDLTGAQVALAKILDDYPESEVALSAERLLGRLYERELGDPERAIPHYRAVLGREPDVNFERETLLSLGECQYRLEQLEEAAKAYRRAVALAYAPAVDAAYFRLATIAELTGDYSASLAWLEELQSRSPDAERRYAALLGQVEILMALARFPDARARLSQAQSLSGDRPESADLLARLDAAEERRYALEMESERLRERFHWGSGRVPGRDH
ncbi:MAG TPA: tetratricopeptide repeat protein, partial [Vicinamibacteria bacterium]